MMKKVITALLAILLSSMLFSAAVSAASTMSAPASKVLLIYANGNQYEGRLLYENAADVLERLNLSSSDFSLLFQAAVKNQSQAVGASGAIYGLLVAFAFMFPNAELSLMFIPVPIKAKYFVPVIVLIDLFSGVTGYSIFGGGVAHFAHVGGALFGFLMMWYWKKNQFDKNRWDR